MSIMFTHLGYERLYWQIAQKHIYTRKYYINFPLVYVYKMQKMHKIHVQTWVSSNTPKYGKFQNVEHVYQTFEAKNTQLASHCIYTVGQGVFIMSSQGQFIFITNFILFKKTKELLGRLATLILKVVQDGQAVCAHTSMIDPTSKHQRMPSRQDWACFALSFCLRQWQPSGLTENAHGALPR